MTILTLLAMTVPGIILLDLAVDMFPFQSKTLNL